MKVEFVACKDYIEVVQAIRDMVTQSMGPWLASAYGMVLAAHSAKEMNPAQAREYMEKAADVLGHARPTTSAFQVRHMQKILKNALQAMESGKDIEQTTLEFVHTILEERYRENKKIGSFAAVCFQTRCVF